MEVSGLDPYDDTAKLIQHLALLSAQPSDPTVGDPMGVPLRSR